MQEPTGRGGDLVLAPGEYAYVLDTTKGLVNTIVGPNKVSMSNTDQPVVWDKDKLQHMPVSAERAKQLNSIAPEGFYLALYNPAKDQPRSQTQSPSVELAVGHRVNMPGPVNIALWPGQMAEVIRGHHLRSNQYLLAQVYNDKAATENWDKAVVKAKTDGEAADALAQPRQFAPGQLLIIKGTEVAFFIPPTGIKVVPENGTFVRDAVTLERLEYCILLDEGGNKRFVKGPDVVFPAPTETFVSKVEDGKTVRKFRAIELNSTSGLYIKVIADYTENGKAYKAGDELFITGNEQALYFQREEHSIIRYGDQTKHYAVAIPAGEGRYVLNRNTGKIDLRRGPLMLLCDPRSEVIVRRVLAPSTAALWYPGNPRVIEINDQLAKAAQRDDASAYEAGRPAVTSMTYASPVSNSINALYAAEEAAVASRSVAGETFQRKGTFSPPRTITLDTKYEGAVGLSIWTGYAVLVVPKIGKRHVEVGPTNLLLEYDETLAPLELSTGKPKSDIKTFKTVYLRVANNKVSDKISVETKDLVRLDVTVSYRVNFEGDDHEKWFAVEDYVKLLTDHLRSKLRNVAKRTGIQDFHSNTIDIVRDTVLGPAVEGVGRPGALFEENGMRVYDVEVLDVTIATPEIAQLLLTTQKTALTETVRAETAERQLEITKRTEAVRLETATLSADSAEAVAKETQRQVSAKLVTELAQIAADAEAEARRKTEALAAVEQQEAITRKTVDVQRISDEAALAKARAEVELILQRAAGETEQVVKRAEAVKGEYAATLTAFSDKALAEKIATTLAPIAAAHGISATEVLGRLFEGTPLKGVLDGLAARTTLPLAKEAVTR